MHPKENRNDMKMQISFCGGVWNQICLRCGGRDNPAGAAVLQNGAFPAKIPPTSGRVRGAFRVSGWAVCQRAESFRSTWRFLIYKEGRQDCLRRDGRAA